MRDLWGDYELLFGASKLNLISPTCRFYYQERIYGVTKMNKVFVNGVRMSRICFHAWLRMGGQKVSESATLRSGRELGLALRLSSCSGGRQCPRHAGIGNPPYKS